MGALETELPEQQFNTWVRPLQAMEGNGALKLLAPNRFVVDWINANLLPRIGELLRDRKSTRLNSSHLVISYAVFCLKKKKITNIIHSNPRAKLHPALAWAATIPAASYTSVMLTQTLQFVFDVRQELSLLQWILLHFR